MKHLHPNSRLKGIRNTAAGLRARTLIIEFLEKNCGTAMEVASATGLGYRTVLRHLNLLEKKDIIFRLNTMKHKPYEWKLTGLGQTHLSKYLQKEY
jgi:predicted ArsR family transcriptional regulator